MRIKFDDSIWLIVSVWHSVAANKLTLAGFVFSFLHAVLRVLQLSVILQMGHLWQQLETLRYRRKKTLCNTL